MDVDSHLDFNYADKRVVPSLPFPHEIIDGTFLLTQVQFMMLGYVLSHVEPKRDGNVLFYEVDVREFKKSLENENTRFYDDITNDMESFWKMTIVSNSKETFIDGKTGKNISVRGGDRRNRFLREIKYEREGFIVKLQLEEILFLPLLEKLKDSYVRVKNILHVFGNFYQSRLYTLLERYRGLPQVKIGVENLMNRLGLFHVNDEEEEKEIEAREKEQLYYREYKYFKRDILKPCIDRCNQHATFSVSFSEEKKGRNIQNLIFYITPKSPLNLHKNQNVPYSSLPTVPKEIELDPFRTILISEGIPLKTVNYWLKEKGESYCRAQYHYVKSIKREKGNFAGYFVRSCQGDYAKFGK